jgi:hypothetical protein
LSKRDSASKEKTINHVLNIPNNDAQVSKKMNPSKTILLIGNHPLCESIIKQYQAMGCEVESYSCFASVPAVKAYF